MATANCFNCFTIRYKSYGGSPERAAKV